MPHEPSPDTDPQPQSHNSADVASSTSEGSPPSLASAPAKYSPLHNNIEEFCHKIVPTEDEKKVKQEVIEG